MVSAFFISSLNVNPGDDTLRSARRDSSVQNDFGRLNGAVFRTRMRADDNRVSGFQAEQAFKDCGRSRVGGRDDRADDPNRLRNFFDPKGRIIFNYTTGFGVFISIINVFGGIVVFNDLVFHNAHSGFGNRHFSKRNPLFVGSHCRRLEDFVHLLLGIGSEHLLRFSHRRHFCSQRFNGVNDFRHVCDRFLFRHDNNPP